MNNMSANDLVSALRKKASEFNSIATTLEQNFTSGVVIPEIKNSVSVVETIRKYMDKKAYRSVKLAKQFGISREDIEKLLTPQNGFETGEKGWIWNAGTHVKKIQLAPVIPVPQLQPVG